MTLPVSGQTLTNAYLYQLDLDVTVGTLVGIDAAQLLTSSSGTSLVFGTDAATGSETITYTDSSGITTTEDIATAGDEQDTSAFTFTTASGTTFIVSNAPLVGTIADVTVGTLTALVGGLGDVGLTAGATNYVACYVPGTLIETPSGEVAIETLQIGDLVVNAAGDARPIRWIGRRSYGGRFLRGNPHLLPIVLRAGSLGDHVPRRDLRVSPKHAMLIDGVLVPAEELVNDVTILQDPSVTEVEYIHLELDRHDVIMAEGAPSETFVDDESRMMFHNANEFASLYPDAPAAPALYCAPRIVEGYQLEAIRRRLGERVPQPRRRAA